MGCGNCGKTGDYTIFDRHGNASGSPKNVDRISAKEAVESILSYDGTPIIDKNIDQILEARRMRREMVFKQSRELIENMTDDMKRAAILDLVDVYNCEDFMMTYTSPNQALAALYKYVHDPAFAVVVKEFEGLAEAVDTKYEELQRNKIRFHWNRK